MRSTVLAAALIGVGLGACGQPPAQQAATAPGIDCAGLASLAIPDTTIRTAELVAAGAFEAPGPAFPGFAGDYSGLPAFCRVTGSIAPSADSDIRFELWLPAQNWNGRFMQTGNGGAAGSIVHFSLADPLTRGYAVANTDTGHQGGGGDFSWAVGHPEKLIDFQYRAVHELTVAGKAITAAHYGRTPEKSYWVGCSTGGRQGLKEAQRFPGDYDAIVAGAPANNWSPLMSLSVVIQRNLGPGGLGIDKLGMLKEAAIAACDARDGVTDRVIGEPGQCDFDPASLQCGTGQSGQCLSPGEVAAAKRIYAGLVDGDGQVLIPGTGPGSEPAWAGYATPQFSIGTSYFRHVVTADSEWDPASFDLDELARARQIGGAADAMDPDLSAFVARGGKLITYHGTADGLIPYGNSVNYYESVVATLGQALVDESVKLYLVPGMDHCAGGDGAFVVDWLTPLEEWVEQGRTPDALRAAHPAMMPGPPGAPPVASKAFTRPICPFPRIARYRGSGDDTDAASFECVAP